MSNKQIITINSYLRQIFAKNISFRWLFLQLLQTKHMIRIILLSIFVLASLSLDNGLGQTPAMGWNSWNHFGCDISEALIKQTADLLVSTGLAKKGYKYLNLDDCWQISRDPSTKQIIQDKQKFPAGMAALSSYVHSKELLFGLYSDAGTQTCQGRPGSYNYQKIDANTYAKWEVDYLKYDNCHNQHIPPKFRYPLMRDALNKSGRHIYFSMCEWGIDKPWTWAPQVSNSWRTTPDISDKWISFTTILELQANLHNFSKPGAWNDPDMLQVGNGGMTNEEYQSHFALWAVLKSPLLIGCNLKNMSKQTFEILGNQQIIAINQDSLGKQAAMLDRQKHLQDIRQVWGGQISKNRFVYVFFNRQGAETTFSYNLKGVNKNQILSVRQLILHQDVKFAQTGNFTSRSIKSHSVGVYLVTYAGQALRIEQI